MQAVRLRTPQTERVVPRPPPRSPSVTSREAGGGPAVSVAGTSTRDGGTAAAVPRSHAPAEVWTLGADDPSKQETAGRPHGGGSSAAAVPQTSASSGAGTSAPAAVPRRDHAVPSSTSSVASGDDGASRGSVRSSQARGGARASPVPLPQRHGGGHVPRGPAHDYPDNGSITDTDSDSTGDSSAGSLNTESLSDADSTVSAGDGDLRARCVSV